MLFNSTNEYEKEICVMEIGVKLVVKMDENTKYDMGIDIPTEINNENPFNFKVVQETTLPDGKSGSENVNREVIMQVVFGDKEHVYAKVQPPKSVLEMAKVDEYIDSFEASVKEGQFDEATESFIVESNQIEEK